MSIIGEYRNKKVTRDTAVKLVAKFLLQERILDRFLEEIKEIKPYQKGNDDVKCIISYAVTLSLNYGGFCDVFLLPNKHFFLDETHGYDKSKIEFWTNINIKWQRLVGDRIVIKPL